MQIEWVDRYTILSKFKGIPNKCKGPCEGTSLVPVSLPTDDALLSALWRACEIKQSTDDGWHFVPCPECNPEAQRFLRLMCTASETPIHSGSAPSVQPGAVANSESEEKN